MTKKNRLLFGAALVVALVGGLTGCSSAVPSGSNTPQATREAGLFGSPVQFCIWNRTSESVQLSWLKMYTNAESQYWPATELAPRGRDCSRGEVSAEALIIYSSAPEVVFKVKANGIREMTGVDIFRWKPDVASKPTGPGYVGEEVKVRLDNGTWKVVENSGRKFSVYRDDTTSDYVYEVRL